MMKNYSKLFSILVVLLFGSMQTISAQNIVANYMLNETSGSIAHDASGNGLDMPLNGITDDNWVDGSLYLDGTQNGQIDPPASDAFKLESLTVSAWIKHDAEMVDWGDWICGQGDNWGLYLNGDEGLTFYVHHADDWDGVTDGATALYLEGGWHYVVATFDATTLVAKLYRDGELVGESTLPGNIVYSEEDNFSIGAMSGGRFWKGNIKDLRVMDGAASESLIVSYGFNEGSGTTVADASINALDGVLEADNSHWVPGKNGLAVELNNSFITLPEDIAFAQNTLTYSAWIKLTEDLGDEWYPVFTHDFGGTDETGLLIGDGGYVVLHAPGLGLGEVTSWNTEVVKGEWVHVAVTVDAEGNGKVYVNGEETASASGGTPLADPTVEANYIGGVDGHPERNFPGIIIDDFLVLDNALSASDIYNIAHEINGDLVANWSWTQPTGTPVDLGIDTMFVYHNDEGYIDTVLTVFETPDLTGNGFDLAFINVDETNFDGSSIALNGVDEFGTLDSITSTSLHFEEFTISTYIKIGPDALTDWARIAGISDGYGFNVDGGYVGLWCNYGDGWHGSYANVLPINDGEWHFIALTHSNTSGNVFYVDGQIALEQDWSNEGGNQIEYPGVMPFAVATSTSDWGMDEVIRHNKLPGNLHDMSVYNRVLSSNELSNIGSGLIANYDYEEVSGNNVPDVTANEHNGWAEEYTIVEGQYSESAIELADANIRLPDDMAFSQSVFTIASWIKVTEDLTIKEEWYPVFVNDFGGENEVGLLIGDGGYVVLHAPGVGLGEVTSWTNDETPLGEWVHVAATVDAEGNGKVYVNGVETASATGGHALAKKGVYPTYLAGAQDPVRNFLGVVLDDTRFYNRALSAEEIALLVSVSYSLSYTVVGQGAVSLSPEGGEYIAGTEVEMTATAVDGFEFTGWSGDVTSTENPLVVTIDADMSVTATFEAIKYALEVTIVGNGTVTPGSGEYTGVMALTATPDEGWEFDSWSGDLTGTDNPGFIEMNEAKNVTATFIDVSGIDDPEMNAFGLSNYPNPFSGKTTISYTLKQDSDVKIIVFDMFGKIVKELVSQSQAPGDYKVELDGSDLESGIYFYQFSNGTQSVTKKMIFNK